MQDADAALAHQEAVNSVDMGMGIADVYAVRGQKDRAFEWLEKAYAHKGIELFYIKGDPLLKTLEGDPRYQAFLRKMKLPD